MSRGSCLLLGQERKTCAKRRETGALLLFTRKLKAEKVYRQIDWTLLLIFVGLFIVVTGLETAVLPN